MQPPSPRLRRPRGPKAISRWSKRSAIARPSTINGTIAFVTGLISSWSSASGVVLPAFLPTVPSLVARVGGGDPLAVALSINIGSSLVDVSPLSTLGALCVATVSDPAEARILFRRLLIWGLSMTVVGALIAQAIAGFGPARDRAGDRLR